MSDGLEERIGMVDDRDREGTLTEFGLSADVRSEQGRESRVEAERASEFGVDDRSDPSRGAGNKQAETEQDELGADDPGLFRYDEVDDDAPEWVKEIGEEYREKETVADGLPKGREVEEELFTARATDADISLSPDEAFDAVGATSSRAIGGFSNVDEGETDRYDRETAPPGMEKRDPDPVFLDQNIEAAEAEGVMEPDRGETTEFESIASRRSAEPVEIEFAKRDEAARVRDLPAVSEWLDESDDRRTATVRLSPDAPDRVVDRLRTEASFRTEDDRESAGMADLSAGELDSLDRQHRTFSWQQHGFEAMRVKAALKRKGATEWMDFFEPGEGVEGALGNLRSSKASAAETGAPIGVGGQRTDEEEIGGGGRRSRQSEQFHDEQVKAAEAAAIVDVDTDAQAFLQEEQDFGAPVWDLAFTGGPLGLGVVPTGRTADRIAERHAGRSSRAQTVDERKAAPKTRDPIKWTNAPARWDFPGVDTIDPQAIHDRRSDRAKAVDESRAAILTYDPEQWAAHPGRYDYPGVDEAPLIDPEAADALAVDVDEVITL